MLDSVMGAVVTGTVVGMSVSEHCKDEIKRLKQEVEKLQAENRRLQADVERLQGLVNKSAT